MRIPVAKGRKFVRGDLKSFTFLTSKSIALFMRKVNPRKVFWTTVYRQLNKKGTKTEVEAKKKTRRAVRVNRGYAGISAEEIAKRKQKLTTEQKQKNKKAAEEKIKEKKAANAAKKEEDKKAAKAMKGGKKDYNKKAAKQPKTGKPQYNSR